MTTTARARKRRPGLLPWTAALLGVCLAAAMAEARPIAIAKGEKAVIILTDEPCALDAVANLPYRMTWTEDNRIWEGCFNIHQGLVIAYFDDRTIAVLPLRVFEPAKAL